MRPTMPVLNAARYTLIRALPPGYVAQINRIHRRVQPIRTRATTAEVVSTMLDMRLVERTHRGEMVLVLMSVARPLTPKEQRRLTHAKTAFLRFVDWSR